MCYPYNPSEYDGFKYKLESLDDETLGHLIYRAIGKKQKNETTIWDLVYALLKLDPDIIEDVIILPNHKMVAHLNDKLDHRHTKYKK
jgi:hypothetical protein